MSKLRNKFDILSIEQGGPIATYVVDDSLSKHSYLNYILHKNTLSIKGPLKI